MSVATTMRGRDEVVAEVCARIATGESVAACFRKPPPGTPSLATFWRWIADDPEVEKRYDAALAARGGMHGEQVVSLADEKPPKGPDGKVDQGWVAWHKNRIEARKWNAARMQPKKYGDRTILAGDADNPLSFDFGDARSALLSGLTPKPAGNGTEDQGSGT